MGFLFPSKWNTQLYVLSNVCTDISSLYLAEDIWPLILKTSKVKYDIDAIGIILPTYQWPINSIKDLYVFINDVW